MSEELTVEQRQEIVDCLLAGKKIHAVKLYRDATGLGLKDAKDVIDELCQELSEEHPELLQQNKGCSTTAAALVLGAITGFLFLL